MHPAQSQSSFPKTPAQEELPPHKPATLPLDQVRVRKKAELLSPLREMGQMSSAHQKCLGRAVFPIWEFMCARSRERERPLCCSLLTCPQQAPLGQGQGQELVPVCCVCGASPSVRVISRCFSQRASAGSQNRNRAEIQILAASHRMPVPCSTFTPLCQARLSDLSRLHHV